MAASTPSTRRWQDVAVRAVFVSGPGGAGKTTIARLAQALLSDQWLFLEVDKCHPHLPAQPALATLEDDRRMARASLGAAYAYVREGFELLVEMNVADPWRRAASEEIFRDVRTTYVVLTARREVTLERVQRRGTDPRWLGWFQADHEWYEGREFPNTVMIDTSDLPPEEVAAEIVRLVESTH